MDKNIYNFNDVINKMKEYLHKEESFAIVNKAYEYASIKHKGQKRKSGEDYIVHLISVAYILATLQAGPQTLAAGLLHDTIEDCNVTYEDLEKEFGEDIASLVESVTKIKQISNSNIEKEEFAAESHRKIFIAMAKDIRVIIIKLADRLHNMRTLKGHGDIATEQRISRETLQVYVPIAHRLGINTVKSELEDLSLKFLEPDKYQLIKELLASKEQARVAALTKMQDKLSALMDNYHIPYSISGRVKSIYSIYKKMFVKGRSFDEIYDLEALRIITDTTLRCYEILGYIHAAYRPIPGRFKDYIAMPKPNMYQSLHTTIVAEDGQIFEVQIRTQEMDEIAETGVASHWRYKENIEYSAKQEQKQIEEKLHWFRDLIAITDESNDATAQDYMTTLQKDIFEANVYCLTPKGRVIELPAGSTPVDFAYRIHTRVGDSTIGATVNGVLVPLSTVLNTGDVVNIKTTKNPNALPNEGWLEFVKTVSAKNHIKKTLSKYDNEIRRDEIIANGKEMLENAIRNDKNIDRASIIKFIESKEFLSKYNLESLTSLYVAITNKTISVSSILNAFREETKKENTITSFSKKKKIVSINGVIVPGIDNMAISFSQCCSPIPGDEIIGYISQGQGIKVHRKDCANIQSKTSKRYIDVSWDYDYFKDNPTLHYVDIVVKASMRKNLLMEIINHLTLLKVSCVSANVSNNVNTFTSTLTFCIEVYDLNHLHEVMNSLLSAIPGIYSIDRYTKN